MSTIDKSCSILHEFSKVLHEIRAEKSKSDRPSAVKGIVEQDKKKILKLFNYERWGTYMQWVDEKLEESGENLEAFNENSRVSSEGELERGGTWVGQEPPTTKKEVRYEEIDSGSEAGGDSEYDLVLNENKRLLRENGSLRKKHD